MPFLAIVWTRDAHEAKAVRDRYSSGDAGRIVGLYHWPSKNTETCNGFCGVMGWTRQKDGAMIHACGKRTAWWRKLGATMFDHLGRNLLPDSITPGLFKNPKGW